MNIIINIQEFLNKYLKLNLISFVLNYYKKNYLISVHHHLPINSVYNLFDQKLNIKVNSCWSEVLILETDNIDISLLSINYTFQNRIPKPKQVLIIKSDVLKYETVMIDYEFIPFDNINQNLTLPYIRSSLKTDDNLSGLSGSPVYCDHKLIGVFSKFDIKEYIAYIIPIYIVIKNLKKKDNTNIYELPLKINKINSYNIKDDMVYHPNLKILVPINTFLILEGDSQKMFTVRHDITNVMINCMTKPKELYISNEDFIVKNNFDYKINSRLLVLLKKIVNKQMISYLFNHISKNFDSKKHLFFSIVENKIKII
jgi:hypothetical protein